MKKFLTFLFLCGALFAQTVPAGVGVYILTPGGSGGGGGGGTVTSVASANAAIGVANPTTSPVLTLAAINLAAAGSGGVTGDLPFANITPATAASLLLGRGSASGGGDFQEITLGAGLTMTGTTLSSSASSGTVTSVSFTGGLISVGTPTSTPAFTVAGTSGGIPYFSASSTWASSAALAANAIVIGGGAGSAPATTTTGSGILTALGINVGSAGAPVLFNGAGGTPSSITLANGTSLPDGGLTLTDVTTNNVSITKHGFAPKGDNNSAHFLDGTGAYSTPAGSGGNVSTGGTLTSGSLVIGQGTQSVAVTTTGTGIVTALGVNVGSAGAPVLFNGAGGTPSSLTGTNITGTAVGLTAGAATNGLTAASAASGAGVIWQSNGADRSAVASNTLGTIAVTTANVTTLTLSTALQLFSDPAPTTGTAGYLAFDNNAWASGRGAMQVYDGTANTFVVAALASDTPTNGQVPTWNTGGTITWETVSSGSASLSGLTAATGSNTIANGNNTGQVWNWANTTDSTVALTLGETTAATNGTSTSGVPNQVGLKLSTLAASTMSPLSVSSRGNYVFSVSPSTSQVLFTDGTAGSPVISFASATGNGMYSSSSTVLGFSVGGVNKVNVTSNGFSVVPAGSASTLSVDLSNGNGFEGFFDVSATALGVSVNGVENARFGARILQTLRASADATGYALNFRKSRGSSLSPTVITTGDDLSTISGYGYVGATNTYLPAAQILFDSTGTIADTTSGIGGQLKFLTTLAGTDTSPQLGLTLAGGSVPTATFAGNITLGASTSSITGAAGNMTIVAGTGNSRTMTLQSTTSGGTATAFLTGNADQTVTLGAVPAAGDTSAKAVSAAYVATAGLVVPNAQTGTTYTLVLGDGVLGTSGVTMNNASANTLTVPTNASVAFAVGTQIPVIQLGAGATTIAAAGGVTINSPGGLLTLSGQYGAACLLKTATNTWQLVGTNTVTSAAVLGTTTNDSAAAGVLGEYVSSLVAIGSPVSLTTNTAANITSISLTAGDWDVTSLANVTETTSTVTARTAGISTTSATLPTDGSEGYNGVQSTLTSETNSIPLNRKRISLSTTTTVYLVEKVTFSAGTAGGFGALNARRAR